MIYSTLLVFLYIFFAGSVCVGIFYATDALTTKINKSGTKSSARIAEIVDNFGFVTLMAWIVAAFFGAFFAVFE